MTRETLDVSGVLRRVSVVKGYIDGGRLAVAVMSFDSIRLAEETESLVTQGRLRKYYRTARPGRWYGGIASADCCGCNLRCVFCWSGAPRDNPGQMGKFYTPEYIFKKLTACADKLGYSQLRVSGNEPTIGKEHLLELLKLVDQTRRTFILETNGTLIGGDEDYAKRLSKFSRVHVRVSMKGTNQEEFAALTGANPEGFGLQLKALENLINANVPAHPAVMLSFSAEKSLEEFRDRVAAIDPRLAGELEEEYVFLYTHVVERLKRAGVSPRIAYSPGGIPSELI